MHCTAHAKTACTALYNARALHCTTLCTARALLCTHTGASYESYTYRILYAQYNRAITGPGALFERGLYCLVRANGWTSIREGLLFEGGFYSRVYGRSRHCANAEHVAVLEPYRTFPDATYPFTVDIKARSCKMSCGVQPAEVRTCSLCVQKPGLYAWYCLT